MKEVNTSYKTIIDIFCDRVVEGHELAMQHSVQEVQKPGFLVVLLVTFGTMAKSVSRRSAKHSYPVT